MLSSVIRWLSLIESFLSSLPSHHIEALFDTSSSVSRQNDYSKPLRTDWVVVSVKPMLDYVGQFLAALPAHDKPNYIYESDDAIGDDDEGKAKIGTVLILTFDEFPCVVDVCIVKIVFYCF